MTRRHLLTISALFLTLVLACRTSVARAESEQENEPGEDHENRAPATYELVVPPSNVPALVTPVPVTPAPAQPAVEATPAPEPAVDESTTQPIAAPTAVVQTQPMSTSFPWAWVVTRSAGIASFILLGFLTVSGMLLTTGFLYRLFVPSTAWSVHRAIASVLLFSVLTHVGSIIFDSFLGLRIIDILVPFVSPYRPLLVAAGIGGFYLLLLVLATSLYTISTHARFWRTVHVFAFLMFILIFLHGVLIGTDTKQPWMTAVYWTMGSAVGASIVYRLLWKYRRPASAKPARGPVRIAR